MLFAENYGQKLSNKRDMTLIGNLARDLEYVLFISKMKISTCQKKGSRSLKKDRPICTMVFCNNCSENSDNNQIQVPEDVPTRVCSREIPVPTVPGIPGI